jgi:hypothetical protein
MIETTYNGKEAYQCEECGLHYAEGAHAAKCETWCKEHRSCNLEIIASALENN